MKIWHRIYSDYLMSPRLNEFTKICELATKNGYQQISLRQFKHMSEQERLQGPYLLHRHDIDTDPATARKIFEIEKSLGIKSSYYFRLRTLDIKLMKEIEEYGSEASYHYEELSEYCKRHGLTTTEQAKAALPIVRKEFSDNVRRLEELAGYKFTTVAAHGDFVNNRVGVNNIEIVSDPTVLSELGVTCEARDKSLMDCLPHYSMDRPYPVVYEPLPPHQLLETNENVLFVTHPRQWRTHWRLNSIDNVKRFIEGYAFNRAARQHCRDSVKSKQSA